MASTWDTAAEWEGASADPEWDVSVAPPEVVREGTCEKTAGSCRVYRECTLSANVGPHLAGTRVHRAAVDFRTGCVGIQPTWSGAWQLFRLQVGWEEVKRTLPVVPSGFESLAKFM